jgi:hypothetical protein
MGHLSSDGIIAMAGDDVVVEVIDIEALEQDPDNENVGSARGADLISRSIQTYGPGPSGVVDKKLRLIGGNKTAEQMKQAGVRRVLVVDGDPDTWIVVRRSDLDLDKTGTARGMARVLNRSQEVSYELDAAAMAAALDLDPDDPSFAMGWGADELEAIRAHRDELAALEAGLQDDADPEVARRALAGAARIVKAVLWMEDVGLFERAIAATGSTNRAEALATVCAYYLSGQGDPLAQLEGA